MVKICLDAGHGHNTSGKRSPADEREWDWNSKILVYCQNRLNEFEDVNILRVDDPTGKTDIPLQTRTDKANSFNADLYISFHNNANTSKWGDWQGTETFSYIGSNPKSEAFQKIVHPMLIQALGTKDRGQKEADFHVLRETKMASLLIEFFFMDSTIDIKKLRDESYLKKAGITVAEAVVKYFGLKPKAVAPKPTQAPTSTKLFRVQVGAFSKRENAENLAKELKAKGYPTIIKED